MPKNMAVQSPNSWVITGDADDDVRVASNGDGVTPDGVFEIPGSLPFTIEVSPPANNLEVLSCD